MFVVRDVFRCKPGKARELAERFKKTVPSCEEHDGFTNCRVMVDAVADYWTVVLECDFERLDDFEGHMRDFGGRAEVKEALAGYMDLVVEGHREIYRLV
jgi:heme-degrading monooxygenase HmoA